jgi:hypothetical protein
MSRVLVVLNAPEKNLDFLYYAKFIATCFAQEPLLANPTLPLAVFEAHIAELEARQTLTLTRALGTVDSRNAQKVIVYGDMVQLKVFVQCVADAHPLDMAAGIIVSSGMSVKRSSGHGKPDFEVKLGPVPGSVHLYARAPKTRAAYDWAYSIDGLTWIRVDTTVNADTIIPNLALRTRYFFRYRIVTKEGVGDWSQPVSILVF